MKDILISFLVWIGGGFAAVAVIDSFVNRRASKKWPESIERNALRRPDSILPMSVGSAFLFVGFMLESIVRPDRALPFSSPYVFAVLSAICLYSVASYFRERHDIDEEGMVHRRILGSERAFSWSQIRSIRYRNMSNEFVLRLDSGEKVTVGGYLCGVSEFAQLILECAPATAIDETTRQRLIVTAKADLIGSGDKGE